MKRYRVLDKQVFSQEEFSIVPVRSEDRFDIMRWRNEQMYHLRQNNPLTPEEQDRYFDEVVAKLFDQEKPNQILFSYLEGEKCIGYGGLVHINWADRNAEISFIMDSALEHEYFEFHWHRYLSLIHEVAVKELCLHKVYTYAIDTRPRLYSVIEECGFEKEAILREHIFSANKFLDVVIHGKILRKT